MVDSQIVKVSTIRLSLFFNGKCKELWRNRSVQNVNFTIYNGIFLYYRFFFANACFGLRVANIGHLWGLCRSFPKHYGLNFFWFSTLLFCFFVYRPFFCRFRRSHASASNYHYALYSPQSVDHCTQYTLFYYHSARIFTIFTFVLTIRIFRTFQREIPCIFAT